MKKTLHVLCMCLVTYFVTAQEPSKNQIFSGNAAVDYKSTTSNLHLQMQVGSTVISTSHSDTKNNLNTSVGFPYGILYISPTFVIDGFEVSKGYFTDRVNIKWELGANQNIISKINIYRKELGSSASEKFIASVSKDVFEYDDKEVEAGVLYQYKIEAFGVSAFNERYINYIDGVGFRNPTATVTGSVSFDGGSPVQDVIVFAEATGESNTSDTSLKITDGNISIDKILYDIPVKQLTLQAWIAGKGDVFKVTTNDNRVVKIYGGKTENNTIKFSVSIDNVIIQETELQNSYPTGVLDPFGKDVFENIANLTENSFIHITATLEEGKAAKFYINGREISNEYLATIKVSDGVTTPAFTINTISNYNLVSANNIQKILLADNYTGYLDEVRIWQRLLSLEEIRRDYRRYIGGLENGLSVYLRMNEKTGNNIYDLSKKGFRANKNDGYFTKTGSTGIEFSTVIPTKNQLGVFGVTDANGSYTISSIAYSGNGESFLITPSLGVHKFEPASQTLFLGAEASIVNQLKFKDISSFKFNGRAVYNVENVFKDIPLDTDEANYTQIEDYGYNKYRVNGNVIINKGQFYYEGGSIDPANGFYKDGVLKKYPVIGLEKAVVYIDGDIVINSDNQPVTTDANGNFSINVPIGKHKVEVKKDGHTFTHTGSFPASSTFDFFEDQIEERWFLDTTRISLIGRVVGGKLESEKPIGFGLEDTFTYTNYEGKDNEEKETVSSINNIGVANIILKGDINTATLDVPVATNTKTGEYQVSLIPYIYYLKSADLTIPKNPVISILNTNETLNLTATPKLDSIAHKTKDGKELYSKTFHHKKSFRYNSPVSLELISQDYEKELKIEEVTYDLSTLEHPLYIQKKGYNIVFEVSQNYVNKDGDKDIVIKEFYTEGTFSITNNLEIAGKSKTTLINNGKQYNYFFLAGIPNITLAEDFLKSMSVQYNISGKSPISISNINDFKAKGFIKGGAATSGTAFATIAPEKPDIILRDPPGSNSFASIEKGTTISFSTSDTRVGSDSYGVGARVSVGPSWEVSAGGPGFLVGTDTEIVASVEGSISRSAENIDEKTTMNSYTFNTTISTSDDPNFVGSDGDLYIGNAKNVYYGLFNNMFLLDKPQKLTNGVAIAHKELLVKDKEGNDVTLYLGTKQDIYIAEQPTKTFFQYSQKYIVETLIPDLENLAANYIPDPNATKDPLKPKPTSADYIKQANSWKKIIAENERKKYEVFTNKSKYKKGVLDVITKKVGTVSPNVTKLINENFFSNRSFDAGLGEFTSSVTTAILVGTTAEQTIEYSAEATAEVGLYINAVGGSLSFSTEHTSANTSSRTSEEETETTISYTLIDNDDNNVLSVDVINTFDGNGPIFVTLAGATSCPYEGAGVSLFYDKKGNDTNGKEDGGVLLSKATNSVYLPEIKADKVSLTNVPESQGALFTLLLKNKSETKSDLEYIIQVSPTSLNGATTNLDQNGVNIQLPYNKTVSFPFEVYKSAISSEFKYENIRVYLKPPCDEIDDDDDRTYIDVSVEFKKACSKVAISAPQDNWIFNRSEGYSVDASGNTTTKKLPITFTDFNTDFAGFRKIELQYRDASSANWIKFKTYYGTQALLDEASDDSGEVIDKSNSEYTYNWDIIGNKVSDGNYEFRAISFCTDDVLFISPIIKGTINLSAPVLFGTPEPSDGILGIGENISLRYNENIFQRVATNIKVTGLSNQQDIDHSVSVYLDGGANQVELPNQILTNGSLTMQFWYKNATTARGNLITQKDGINAVLNGNELTFSIGNESVTGVINPSQYNFYSLVYQSGTNAQLVILENGTSLKSKSLSEDLKLNTKNSIFIGGTNTIGNIHDVRFWSKTFTQAQATVAKDKTLTGRELSLLGYWALDEGNGNIGVDKAKSRNATVNLGWDIKPKGTAYSFANNAYLSLTNVGFVQPSVEEDITMSFWVKTAKAATSTLFSNGKGNQEDAVQGNGYRNKWSVNMLSDGSLELLSEDISYKLSSKSVADNNWHHIAFIIKRGGSINSYEDGLEVSSVSSANIGGISGNKMVVGARLFKDLALTETIDNHFTGNLDEIRLWNTARSIDQIKRDRYFEIDATTDGLMLYVNFNKEDTNTTKGPQYKHAAINNTTGATFAILSGTSQSYTVDSPALKPELKFTNIPFSTVINGDQMIINPELTTEQWSLFENQILNFSVSRMYDTHFNEQRSPISWSAFVKRQEIEWFTQDKSKVIKHEKKVNEDYTFTMDLINIGGSNQPYTISGLPTWIQVASVQGTVSPNATEKIVFTVDKELAIGTYTTDLFLETASGFNDKLNLELRVLEIAPNWAVNQPDYSNSMNIIGKIKVDSKFSRDQFTKIGAFVNDKPRGEAYLTYDKAYDSYYVYLTAYSNVSSGEEMTFKIWDALNGKVLTASMDDKSNTPFLQNEILGSKSKPIIFSGSLLSEQTVNLNNGWTWVSFFVGDERFNNVKSTLDGLTLQDNDLIKSQNEFTRYENEGWFGSLSTLESTKMYKVKLANANALTLKGNDVDEANLNLVINEGWNWLPFPIHKNISLQEALSLYNPKDGDVIKDQYSFAIYDAISGWNGSLNYMQSNRGYMIKSGTSQTINYPTARVFNKTSSSGQEYSNKTIAQFSKYSSNMSVVAEVIGGNKLNKVIVYDSNGVVRGESPIVTLRDKKMSFVSVFSNSNDILRFILSDGITEIDVTSSFVFENNKVLGNLETPVILSAKSLSTDTAFLSNIILYPNPFSSSITIDSSQQTEKVNKIEIYSTIGVLVKKTITNTDKIIIDTKKLSKGIYLIKVTLSNGSTSIKKMVKK